MAPIESTWTNARGQRLHSIAYAPSTPKALVCFHHGYAEHIGRYHAVFSALSAKGLAVHSYDAHAHGRSEPLEEKKRVFINHFDDLVRALMLHISHDIHTTPQVDDFTKFIARTKQAYSPSVPCFLFGHSIGGLVCAHTVLRQPDVCAGFVLSSPALHVHIDFVQRCAGLM
jgi:acylglycerol lipase